MKILVFSDSHNDTDLMKRAIEKHKGSTDLIIHLGDCVRDTMLFSQMCPHIANINIMGNCDFSADGITAYYEKTITLGNTGIRAFLCHGHAYRVKSGTDILFTKAKKEAATVALFGHTHIASISEKNGILIMNPGSASRPRSTEPCSYGILNIENGIVSPTIVFDR